MRRPLTLLLTLAALAGVAAPAAAQACLGIPTRDGQIAVAGALGLADDYDTAGGEFHVDPTGPASFSFGYARDFGTDELVGGGDPDAIHLFSARAAYEFYLLDPSICAVAGVWYRDSVHEQLGIPVGFGFGKTLRSRRMSATVYALPQYVRVRESFGHSPSGSVEETSNEFMAEAGANVAFAHLYFGGGVVVTTIGDAEPRFQLRAGLIF
ncbi:MAG: hypothetical protein ACLFRX_07805 [Gemmatimonadota bacterium]